MLVLIVVVKTQFWRNQRKYVFRAVGQSQPDRKFLIKIFMNILRFKPGEQRNQQERQNDYF